MPPTPPPAAPTPHPPCTTPQTLDAFLAAKARLDDYQGEPPLSEVMGVAHAATTLRALLLRALSSGLRNDAPDGALSMRQRFRVAELRCEDYLFVLMSRFINALERQVGGGGALRAFGGGRGREGAFGGGRSALLLGVGWGMLQAASWEGRAGLGGTEKGSSVTRRKSARRRGLARPRPRAQGGAAALAAARSSVAWSHPLAMLLLGVRNIGLGGWMPGECMAIENEVTAWQEEAEFDQKDNALRWGGLSCLALPLPFALVGCGRLSFPGLLTSWPPSPGCCARKGSSGGSLCRTNPPRRRTPSHTHPRSPPKKAEGHP